MENTPFVDLYKWDPADEKQETINQMANNSQKIDNKLSEHHGRLDLIDKSLITIDGKATTADAKATSAETIATTADAKATSAEAKATAADANAASAKDIAETVESRFNEVIAEAGSNNPEVVDARGSFVTLGQRFDDTAAQLADMIQDVSITVTVGTGGNYTTINDAISFLSKKRLKHGTSIRAQIKLLSGFVMRERVTVTGLDLGWIKIISEDAVVDIDPSGFQGNNFNYPSYDGYTMALSGSAVFAGLDNATLPVIGCLFNMLNTTTLSVDAFVVMQNSKLYIENLRGCTNAKGRGIYAAHGSFVSCNGANMQGAGTNCISVFRQSYLVGRGMNGSGARDYGAYVDSNSKLEVIASKFTDCGKTAIYADSSSSISCTTIDVSRSGGNGILANGASNIDARDSIITNCVGRGVLSTQASRINVANSTITNNGQEGLNATTLGQIVASGSTVTGNTLRGAFASYGGVIDVSNADCRKGETNSSDDMRVVSGGTIYAHNAIGGIGGVPHANQIFNAGIILNNDPLVDGNTFGTPQTFTPSGGWTGTLTYSKTPGGLVWLRGSLTAGTSLSPGSNLGSIVTGYRPPNTMPISSIHGSNNTQYGLHISSSGGVFLSETFVAGTYNVNVLYKVN